MNIPDEAVEVAAEAIADKFLDRALDCWPDFKAEAKAALEAAAPHLMAAAWDEGQKSGMRHRSRVLAAAKIGRPDLPGSPSPNPYRTTK